jgi:hypothetical protein
VPYAVVDQHQRLHGATRRRLSSIRQPALVRSRIPSSVNRATFCRVMSRCVANTTALTRSDSRSTVRHGRLGSGSSNASFASLAIGSDHTESPAPIFAPIPLQCNAMFSGAEYARYMPSRGPGTVSTLRRTYFNGMGVGVLVVYLSAALAVAMSGRIVVGVYQLCETTPCILL